MNKDFFRSLKLSFNAAVMALVWLAALALFLLTLKLSGERELLLREIKSVKEEFSGNSFLLQNWERINRNLAVNKEEFSGFNELVIKLNIKNKQTGFRSAGKSRLDEITRQDAEIVFENLTLNELLNLLYQLEKGNFPLSLKTLQIVSPDFEKDSLKAVIMISSYSK